jgi:hypothetical protein
VFETEIYASGTGVNKHTVRGRLAGFLYPLFESQLPERGDPP